MSVVKKLLIVSGVLIFLSVVVIFSLFVLLNWTSTYTRIIPAIVQIKHPEINFRNVTLKEVRLRGLQSIEFKNFTGEVIFKDSRVDLDFDAVYLRNLIGFIRNQHELNANIWFKSIRRSDIEISQGHLFALVRRDVDQHVGAEGSFKTSQLNGYGLNVKDIQGEFAYSLGLLEVGVDHSEAYGGIIKADLDLQMSEIESVPTYVAVQLELDQVDHDLVDLKQASFDMALELNSSDEMNYQGTFQIFQAMSQNFVFNDIAGKILGDQQEIDIVFDHADFYGGDVEGEVQVLLKPLFPYSANFELDHVDLQRIGLSASAISDNLHGVVSGNLAVAGNQKILETVESSLEAEPGAEIKASLINILAEYFPKRSTQKRDLAILVESGGFVPLEFLNVSFKNNGQKQIKSKVDLTSKSLNINLENVFIDINLDGGLNGLLTTIGNQKR